ncbi:type VI secretion protein [Erwinia sp. OLTSP20]|uniref:type VI secretion system baseplate subunit TssF n=1 Tax=unclassified Erwinia TaxID=2622719 RepID=UPI000C190E15|nr:MULTISPECIES: type VI secretion system baseplate subunit TssF [unclassified Erwinia]PIJ48258.1 type VI secretion protein [Erwinia sp. OAMSP11]PIJ68756.1 type VI secretion protein [Erwinia sp. OLSSP12]PIJ78931.1 type VI secretion protein [Erwinia sp. OLCASP19]PIJ79541.1 type VI secretion protein [Erwinia sp. OLMTSP26]PIJ81499.1 type VI secretion protein [Erwinia sp. OLMDSP33]
MNRLLSYYQHELNFLKQHGKAFASRFPKIARRLRLVEGETEDPHVSRLIESFALLTAGIHQRLDDDIPEVIDALLATLAPQFLRALPAACIVMISPDPHKSGLTGKNLLPADSALFTRHSNPLSCQFQTVYPVTLLPLSVNQARLSFNSDELRWQLTLTFHVWHGATLSDDSIRLYLHGPANAVNRLYTLLCAEVSMLTLRQGDSHIPLETSAIRAVGFDSDEAMLTQDKRIAPIHILLLDYFWFSDKFSFIDIQLPAGFTAAGNTRFELHAVFQRHALTEKLEKLVSLVDAEFFRLHCTPAVNLFSRSAEPITLNDAITEYPVIADTRHQNELDVWSVRQVSVQRKIDNQIENFTVMPLLESHPGMAAEKDSGLLWQLSRHTLPGARLAGYKPFIAFSSRSNTAAMRQNDVVNLSVYCTNHRLPNQLHYGHPEGDFELQAPVAALTITALTHPSSPVNPPDKSDARWRFYAQLTLNHQLLQGEQGVQRLKETLTLYNLAGNADKTRLLSLIIDLRCQPVTTRLISNDPHSLARGIDITVVFAQDARAEPDLYLLCCLLDRLLALYAPVNSFTRMTTCIEHESRSRRVWPIRAGKLSWL